MYSIDWHTAADGRRLAAGSPSGTDGVLRLLRFAAGEELRAYRPPADSGNRGYFRRAVVRPDGRVVAVCTRTDDLSGTSLLDARTGRELARLPGQTDSPLQFAADGALLTYGATGVVRWAYREEGGHARFGPPEAVVREDRSFNYAASADGTVLARGNHFTGAMGAIVYHAGGPGPSVFTGPQIDVRNVAVSPDGRLVATGSHTRPADGMSAQVSDAETGRLVKALPVGGMCEVGFSTDGGRLVTTGGGLRAWRTDTWEELCRPAGTGWCFYPSGQLLAVGGHGHVRLVRTDTGEELARLAVRGQGLFRPAYFSPAGGELGVFGDDTFALHVWDLRLVRRQLAELNLDWDAPPIPPPAAGLQPPARVEFVRDVPPPGP